jgi:hypothetical protein
MQTILNHEYGIFNRSVYAYSEDSTVKLERLTMDSRLVGQIFRKYRPTLKPMLYRGAFALNRPEWLVRRRSRPPTLKEVEEFQRARRTVALKVEEIFETSVPIALRRGSAHE